MEIMNNKSIKEFDMEKSFNLLLDEFSEQNVRVFLINLGLLEDEQGCTIEKFEKLVFLKGNENEMYVQKERQIIEAVKEIYIYPNYYKKTQKESMPCRLLAASLDFEDDEIYECLAFMKIVNKAIDGFNIFLLKSNNKIFLGCRIFEISVNKDCAISYPFSDITEIEEIAEELLFLQSKDDFISYYNYLLDAINLSKVSTYSYEEFISKKRGIRTSYLELLNEIEYMYGLNFHSERVRYNQFFERNVEENYQTIVDNILLELSFIKPSKINSMEMLFDAEERVKLAKQSEEKYNHLKVDSPLLESGNNINIQDVEEYFSDPEMLVKILKMMKGI